MYRGQNPATSMGGYDVPIKTQVYDTRPLMSPVSVYDARSVMSPVSVYDSRPSSHASVQSVHSLYEWTPTHTPLYHAQNQYV